MTWKAAADDVATTDRLIDGASSQEEKSKMKKYVCEVCGWVYDPEQGDSNAGISPGVDFKDLPEDYVCPVCGAGKDQFAPEE